MPAPRVMGLSHEFIISLLRVQIGLLNRLQAGIEEYGVLDDHIEAGLKQVEKNIRGLRKMCFNNF